MALTVTVADNQDGSGGVATIAGSDSGSTNTVYLMSAGASVWTSAGSRTGNGTLNLSVSPGYYFAYCHGTLVSAAPALSAITSMFALTREAQSVYGLFCDDLAATIQTAIAAESIPNFKAAWSDRVTKAWALHDENTKFPHVFVTPPRAGGQEQTTGGTNLRDDWLKPVQVSVVDRCDERYTANFDEYLLARERLMRLVNNRRFDSIAAYSPRAIVQPQPIVQFIAERFQYLITSFIAAVETREPRTP